ncbi:MAG: formate dehydrogenase subunit gamma [Gammaproteobacteria bacterium]|nr:formate dehydrogenase subunit gamma [Gammaproteobacteria bacterium]
MKKALDKKARRRRIATYSLLAILALAVALPLASYSLHWLGHSAIAQEATNSTNPRGTFWGLVKDGTTGYSAVKGEGANQLIQAGGWEWQLARSGAISTKLPWIIAIFAGIILLYHLISGRNKLSADKLSGRKVKRWGWFDRLVHWVTAISFIALAITGLSMLLGRAVLIPLLGKAGFASWANMSITIHNFIGPVFSVGVALMIIMWIWHNFPTVTDLKWFAQGGGLIGDKHPSAGRMNGGEKVWFWLVAIAGVAVSVTGLIMVSPIFGWQIPGLETARANMQQANIIHAVAGIIWTAVALGHIYIGTAGTEGAFEGMSTGYVSEEWAKQHHDLWYEKMASKGKVDLPTTDQVVREATDQSQTRPQRPARA